MSNLDSSARMERFGSSFKNLTLLNSSVKNSMEDPLPMNLLVIVELEPFTHFFFFGRNLSPLTKFQCFR